MDSEELDAGRMVDDDVAAAFTEAALRQKINKK